MTIITTGTMTIDPWGVVPQRLRPPSPRPGVLTRTALLDRLLEADASLVTVRAGAGYGKTTLLGQWAEHDLRPAGWLSIDVADNDPVVLLRHLVRALGSCRVDIELVEHLLQSREPQVDREVLPALATALERRDAPFLLMFDDVHLIDHPDAVAILDELARLIPDDSTLAMAGRMPPRLRLARRALSGDLLQLDQIDLAYAPSEAQAVVQQLDQLAPTVAQELVRCTDGWPAGLYLGILALAEHPDPPVVLRGLLAADHRVAEYLHQEVLDGLSVEWRSFLAQASVLDRLSGPLCDAVMERDDSAAVLDALAASGNLFVLSFGDRTTYRLHDLFAELLLSELRRTDPAAESSLRRRAARWHDAQGESDAAVRQAFASGDRSLASSVLYRQLFPTIVRGQIATLARWLDAVPQDQVRADGLMSLCAGWLSMSLGQRGALELHVADARSANYEGVLPDGTVSYAVGLAALEMTASLDGIDEVAAHAAVVRAAGPTGSPWSGMAALLEAIALGYAGRSDLVEELERAELESRGMPLVHAVALAQLGIARIRRGDRHSGTAVIMQGVAELREHRLESYSLAAIVHCAHSLAAALQGDRDASLAAADRGNSIRAAMAHVVARAQIHTGLLLCEAAILRREPTVAAEELETVRRYLPAEPEAVVLHQWAEELGGRLAQLSGVDLTVELTTAELRVLAQLPTHRSSVEIGELLYVSRNTVKSHTLSIYRKFGVSSRSEAVDRARDLGLLDRT